jgi:hypothetical protein
VVVATFTMLSSFFLGNRLYSPWSFNGNPICVRGLAREKLVYPQGCRLSQDESSLSFTMLLRLESLFPFSSSPPLAGGNITMLGDILLDSDSYIMSVPDRRSRIIPEVVLVRRWAVGVLGIWKGGGLGEGWGKGGQFTSNLRPRWTEPVTARRVPSK